MKNIEDIYVNQNHIADEHKNIAISKISYLFY